MLPIPEGLQIGLEVILILGVLGLLAFAIGRIMDWTEESDGWLARWLPAPFHAVALLFWPVFFCVGLYAMVIS